MALKQSKKVLVLRPRFRVVRGDTIALGPGKIELLAQLAETGSLTQAAQQLGMSYMRAWTLMKTMNRCFRDPLVLASRGGKRGGGMEITETGRKALGLYQEMESRAMDAAAKPWKSLRALLQE
jgi:molybdate transport system regulatory protein